MSPKLTVYRLEDSSGVGPAHSKLGMPDGVQLNPWGMSAQVAWGDGDDIWQFKYACSSMKNLEYYMGKSTLAKLLNLGYKIITLEVSSDKIRYARTKKVLAYQYTSSPEAFFDVHRIEQLDFSSEEKFRVSRFIARGQQLYHEWGYNKDPDYFGQFGVIDFLREHTPDIQEQIELESGAA